METMDVLPGKLVCLVQTIQRWCNRITCLVRRLRDGGRQCQRDMGPKEHETCVMDQYFCITTTNTLPNIPNTCKQMRCVLSLHLWVRVVTHQRIASELNGSIIDLNQWIMMTVNCGHFPVSECDVGQHNSTPRGRINGKDSTMTRQCRGSIRSSQNSHPSQNYGFRVSPFYGSPQSQYMYIFPSLVGSSLPKLSSHCHTRSKTQLFSIATFWILGFPPN